MHGAALRFRRPNDYNPQQAALLGPTGPSPHLNLAAVGLTPGSTVRVHSRQFPFQLPNTQIPPNYHPNADRSPPLNTVQAQNAAAIPGHIPGIPSTQNSDGRKLYVGNLPTYLTEVQVYELLQSFGRISAFNLVVDKETGALKGYGYVYFNP